MKNFKNTYLVLIGFLFIVAGCKDAEKLTTADGVEYYLLDSENGEVYEQGDFATYYIKMVDSEDSTLIDSEEVGVLPLQIDSAIIKQRGKLFSILQEIKVGDSIRTTLTANEVFTIGFRQPLSPEMKAEDRITVFATAKAKYDSAGFMAWQQEMRKEMQEKRMKEAEAQIDKDRELITTYLSENSLEADSTATGLFYMITERGEGPKPEVGDTVMVKYTGRLLDGTVFDTSVESVAKEAGMYNENRPGGYTPLEFPVGRRQVIKGWDEGLLLLNKGAKATFIIPSNLAYGQRGQGRAIGPNEVLLFEVELVDIK